LACSEAILSSNNSPLVFTNPSTQMRDSKNSSFRRTLHC
jgi:hypothetical protein